MSKLVKEYLENLSDVELLEFLEEIDIVDALGSYHLKPSEDHYYTNFKENIMKRDSRFEIYDDFVVQVVRGEAARRKRYDYN